MSNEDNEILEEFILESTQNITEIEQDLLALEENGSDSETINRMFRAIHSMKGSSGYLKLNNILAVSHLGETLLDEIRKNIIEITPDVADTLLAMIDAINDMFKTSDLGKNYDTAEILSRLNAVLSSCAESENTEIQASAASGNSANTTAILTSIDFKEKEKLILETSLKRKENLFLLTLKEDITDEDDSLNELMELGQIITRIPPARILYTTVIEEDMLQTALQNILAEIVIIPADSWKAKQQGTLPTSTPPDTSPAAPTRQTAVSSRNEPKLDNESQKHPPQNTGKAAKEEAKMIKINARLLDELLRFTGNMVMSRNQLLTQYDFSDNPAFSTLSQAITEVHRNVVQTRMLSVGSIFDRFKRIIRDLSRQLGKKIEFKQQGGDMELDRTILEAFIDPLNHMIRNSIDHGIETAEERKKTLKNPIASITLKAYQESGEIIISVEDDGRGIDPDRIKSIAVKRGLVNQLQADTLSRQEIIMLIFEPGFSTAKTISEISGRGVGMDVVRTNIEKIGGVIDCVSELGEGTKILARLPLTKAMVTSSLISALIVSVEDQRFCIPQNAVNELITVSKRDSQEKIKVLQGQKVFQHRELILPLLELKDILEIQNTAAASPEDTKASSCTSLHTETKTLIVLQHRNNLFGIMVDDIIGIEEAVVRDMPKLVEKVNVFSGHTVLGDGRVVMIIDTNGIVERMNMTFISPPKKEDAALPALSVGKRADRQSMIIFNYSENEFFAVPLELVSLVEKISHSDICKVGERHYYPMKDNTIPLLYLDKHLPITPISLELKSYNLILPSRVKYPIGVITNSKITVCDVSGKFDEKITNDKGVLGTFMHEGKLVMLLDLYSLFECDDPERFYKDNDYREDAQILIVEDSLFYRRLNATYLQADGRELTLVGDGIEALAALRDPGNHFDLVVSDIEMPNMDGFELIKEIRADPNLKDIPVIALTALQDDRSRDRGLSLGFSEYVVKVDKDGLNESVNRYARQARLNKVNSPQLIS